MDVLMGEDSLVVVRMVEEEESELRSGRRQRLSGLKVLARGLTKASEPMSRTEMTMLWTPQHMLSLLLFTSLEGSGGKRQDRWALD